MPRRPFTAQQEPRSHQMAVGPSAGERGGRPLGLGPSLRRLQQNLLLPLAAASSGSPWCVITWSSPHNCIRAPAQGPGPPGLACYSGLPSPPSPYPWHGQEQHRAHNHPSCDTVVVKSGVPVGVAASSLSTAWWWQSTNGGTGRWSEHSLSVQTARFAITIVRDTACRALPSNSAYLQAPSWP